MKEKNSREEGTLLGGSKEFRLQLERKWKKKEESRGRKIMDSFGIEGYFFACESNFDRSRLHLFVIFVRFLFKFYQYGESICNGREK